jgi:hypothetical protein
MRWRARIWYTTTIQFMNFWINKRTIEWIPHLARPTEIKWKRNMPMRKWTMRWDQRKWCDNRMKSRRELSEIRNKQLSRHRTMKWLSWREWNQISTSNPTLNMQWPSIEIRNIRSHDEIIQSRINSTFDDNPVKCREKNKRSTDQ